MPPSFIPVLKQPRECRPSKQQPCCFNNTDDRIQFGRVLWSHSWLLTSDTAGPDQTPGYEPLVLQPPILSVTQP